MGGLLVVPIGVILGSLITRDPVASQQLLSLASLTLAFMVIGGIDDWSSLTKHTNTGLTPRGKLLLQAIAAVAFLTIATLYDPAKLTSLRAWLVRIAVSAAFMGVIYLLFAVLLRVQTPRGLFF